MRSTRFGLVAAAPAPAPWSLSVRAAGDDLGLWKVYDSTLVAAKYIDLTHAFAPGEPAGVGFADLTFGPARAAVAIPGIIGKGEPFSYEKHGVGISAYELPT